MSDRDKRAVYDAEHRLCAWLDAAQAHPGRLVTVDGIEHAPEIEPRFTDVTDIAPYVDKVLAHLRDIGADYGGREKTEVAVRERAGVTKAVYHCADPANDGKPTIAIPPRRIGGAWSLRALVVLHEIAHHLDNRTDRTDGDTGPHSASFQATFLRLLEDLGMHRIAGLLHDAYADAGLAGGLAATGSDSTLSKIGKLLRHAERAATEHERDAFLARAQALATQHSVALAVARAAVAKKDRREQPTFEKVVIGEHGKKSLARYARLFVQISWANDLKITIAHNNTHVTLYGFETDIAVAKALYASLVTQMVTDGDRYIRSGAHRKDTTLTWDPKAGDLTWKPVHGTTARAAFYEAWTNKVGQRLMAARREQVAAIEQAETDALPETSNQDHVTDGADGADAADSDKALTSTALAIRAKEIEIHDYFDHMKKQHGVRGTWRGTGSSMNKAPGAARAGTQAGARASLGGERAIG